MEVRSGRCWLRAARLECVGAARFGRRDSEVYYPQYTGFYALQNGTGQSYSGTRHISRTTTINDGMI